MGMKGLFSNVHHKQKSSALGWSVDKGIIFLSILLLGGQCERVGGFFPEVRAPYIQESNHERQMSGGTG